MKTWSVLAIAAVVFSSCQKSEQISDFTGNEVTYALQPASSYAVSGTVTLKELRDGGASIVIEVTGTSGDAKYPAHLHLGDIATSGAPVAALLTPLSGNTGKSETRITQLADESKINYADLIKMKASIKIHLSDSGPAKDVVLAAGNIGSAAANPTGRVGVGVCNSN